MFLAKDIILGFNMNKNPLVNFKLHEKQLQKETTIPYKEYQLTLLFEVTLTNPLSSNSECFKLIKENIPLYSCTIYSNKNIPYKCKMEFNNIKTTLTNKNFFLTCKMSACL